MDCRRAWAHGGRIALGPDELGRGQRLGSVAPPVARDGRGRAEAHWAAVELRFPAAELLPEAAGVCSRALEVQVPELLGPGARERAHWAKAKTEPRKLVALRVEPLPG